MMVFRAAMPSKHAAPARADEASMLCRLAQNFGGMRRSSFY